MTVTTHTLEQDGARPLRFEGETIAETSSHHYQGPRSNRWTEVKLYREVKGCYVAQIRHITCWENETDKVEVFVRGGPVDLIECIGKSMGGEIAPVVLEAFDTAGLDIAEDL